MESRQGSNLLYMPLDKIMQSVGGASGASAVESVSGSSGGGVPQSSSNPVPVDVRGRDSGRSREREVR